MKLLTAVVPCYNAEAYMEKAVNSLLAGGDEMDILLVDDGSTDGTGALADRLAAAHPDVIRVIHQANGGHGSGLNQGIRTARGVYFKVVDSDDRVTEDGLKALLDLLRAHAAPEEQADLVVHDYAYDHGDGKEVFSVNYAGPMIQGRLFTWGECGRFGLSKQFMIHALVYRVGLLREHGYVLPEHTFYEDNLYIYQPLPWTKNLLYLHRKVHVYNVGRDGQSVSEKNMIRRLDQLTRMVTGMATSWKLAELDALPPQLRRYMLNNVTGQILSLSALQYIAGEPEGLRLNAQMWQTIREYDADLFRTLTRHPSGWAARLPGKAGRGLLVGAYHLAHRVIRFG